MCHGNTSVAVLSVGRVLLPASDLCNRAVEVYLQDSLNSLSIAQDIGGSLPSLEIDPADPFGDQSD